MLNNTVLVGRVLEITENQVKMSIPRPYKNEDGIFENDEVVIDIMGNLYTSLVEYCRIGDLVGVKGTIQTGNKLVAEKVTFLSARKED